MSDNDKKRYYWLKLQRDFFKRHDIKIIEDMPNGKDYVIFYLKLLCESITHEGYLRFSDTIPYSPQMLATITNTNVDIVKSAIELFSNLDMINILDDGTYHMMEVQNMIGSETGNAQRKRAYRNNKNNQIGTSVGQCPLEKEIELDKEKDIDKDKDKDKKNKVSLFKEYAKDNKELYNTLIEFEKMRNSIKKPMTDRAKKMLLNKLDNLSNGNNEFKIDILNQSIYKSYQDIYEINNFKNKGGRF